MVFTRTFGTRGSRAPIPKRRAKLATPTNSQRKALSMPVKAMRKVRITGTK